MNLGYFSDSEDDDYVPIINKPLVKPNLEQLRAKFLSEKPNTVSDNKEMGDIFQLKPAAREVSSSGDKEGSLSLVETFKKVAQRQSQLQSPLSEDQNESDEIEGDTNRGREKDMDKQENEKTHVFDMQTFYTQNSEAISSGELDAKEIMNANKKIAFHGGSRGTTGLTDVINWNMTHPGKVRKP